jgi:uncharacterized membrane protein
MAGHPAWAQRFLSESDFDAIAGAIRAAESRTSAEIRVHLERRVPRRLFRHRHDALARAQHVFRRLGMHRTAERHGVLIYVAVEERRLAVVGDEGIHARVGDAHWTEVRDLMIEILRENGPPRRALERAIEALGRALAEHFPRRPDDENELSDDVSVI